MRNSQLSEYKKNTSSIKENTKSPLNTLNSNSNKSKNRNVDISLTKKKKNIFVTEPSLKLNIDEINQVKAKQYPLNHNSNHNTPNLLKSVFKEELQDEKPRIKNKLYKLSSSSQDNILAFQKKNKAKNSIGNYDFAYDNSQEKIKIDLLKYLIDNKPSISDINEISNELQRSTVRQNTSFNIYSKLIQDKLKQEQALDIMITKELLNNLPLYNDIQHSIENMSLEIKHINKHLESADDDYDKYNLKLIEEKNKSLQFKKHLNKVMKEVKKNDKKISDLKIYSLEANSYMKSDKELLDKCSIFLNALETRTEKHSLEREMRLQDLNSEFKNVKEVIEQNKNIMEELKISILLVKQKIKMCDNINMHKFSNNRELESFILTNKAKLFHIYEFFNSSNLEFISDEYKNILVNYSNNHNHYEGLNKEFKNLKKELRECEEELNSLIILKKEYIKLYSEDNDDLNFTNKTKFDFYKKNNNEQGYIENNIVDARKNNKNTVSLLALATQSYSNYDYSYLIQTLQYLIKENQHFTIEINSKKQFLLNLYNKIFYIVNIYILNVEINNENKELIENLKSKYIKETSTSDELLHSKAANKSKRNSVVISSVKKGSKNKNNSLLKNSINMNNNDDVSESSRNNKAYNSVFNKKNNPDNSLLLASNQTINAMSFKLKQSTNLKLNTQQQIQELSTFSYKEIIETIIQTNSLVLSQNYSQIEKFNTAFIDIILDFENSELSFSQKSNVNFTDNKNNMKIHEIKEENFSNKESTEVFNNDSNMLNQNISINRKKDNCLNNSHTTGKKKILALNFLIKFNNFFFIIQKFIYPYQTRSLLKLILNKNNSENDEIRYFTNCLKNPEEDEYYRMKSQQSPLKQKFRSKKKLNMMKLFNKTKLSNFNIPILKLDMKTLKNMHVQDTSNINDQSNKTINNRELYVADNKETTDIKNIKSIKDQDNDGINSFLIKRDSTLKIREISEKMKTDSSLLNYLKRFVLNKKSSNDIIRNAFINSSKRASKTNIPVVSSNTEYQNLYTYNNVEYDKHITMSKSKHKTIQFKDVPILKNNKVFEIKNNNRKSSVTKYNTIEAKNSLVSFFNIDDSFEEHRIRNNFPTEEEYFKTYYGNDSLLNNENDNKQIAYKSKNLTKNLRNSISKASLNHLPSAKNTSNNLNSYNNTFSSLNYNNRYNTSFNNNNYSNLSIINQNSNIKKNLKNNLVLNLFEQDIVKGLYYPINKENVELDVYNFSKKYPSIYKDSIINNQLKNKNNNEIFDFSAKKNNSKTKKQINHKYSTYRTINTVVKSTNLNRNESEFRRNSNMNNNYVTEFVNTPFKNQSFLLNQSNYKANKRLGKSKTRSSSLIKRQFRSGLKNITLDNNRDEYNKNHDTHQTGSNMLSNEQDKGSQLKSGEYNFCNFDKIEINEAEIKDKKHNISNNTLIMRHKENSKVAFNINYVRNNSNINQKSDKQINKSGISMIPSNKSTLNNLESSRKIIASQQAYDSSINKQTIKQTINNIEENNIYAGNKENKESLIEKKINEYPIIITNEVLITKTKLKAKTNTKTNTKTTGTLNGLRTNGISFNPFYNYSFNSSLKKNTANEKLDAIKSLLLFNEKEFQVNLENDNNNTTTNFENTNTIKEEDNNISLISKENHTFRKKKSIELKNKEKINKKYKKNTILDNFNIFKK